MFNYDKATMSEFGRYMGPMFSVFTKWPTSIGGDINYSIRAKKLPKSVADIGYRYMGPLAGAALMEHVLTGVATDAGILDEGREDPRYQKLVGKAGVTGMHPLGSIASIYKGDVLSPPIVSSAVKVVSAASHLSPYDLWVSANDAAAGFVPGAGLVRFMFDDIPTLYTGEKAEGRTLPGKVAQQLDMEDPDEYFKEVDAEMRETLNLPPRESGRGK
jgi:hypothetical protein